MKNAQDNSIREDSGYSTDSCRSSCSESNEPENSSDSDPSSNFQYDASDEEDEGVDSRMEFLNEKQSILTRAAEVLGREESYEAATAFATSNKPPSRPSATWKEAKSVLRTMGHKSKEPSRSNARLLSVQRDSRKRKNPRDPAIDFSSVQRLPAAKFARLETVTTKDENIMGLLSSLPTALFHQGQWMAKALVWSAPTQNRELDRSMDYRWKVVSDPSTYSLGLVPPNGMSMKNAVDIQEAMSISDEAHVVTQATPPFCVVYANKAFLKIADSGSTESIIGRPVESILQISEDIFGSQATPKDRDSSKSYLNGVLRLESSKACRIRLCPVVDRTRKAKDSSSEHVKYSCMSHILIQVVDTLKPVARSTRLYNEEKQSLRSNTSLDNRHEDDDDNNNNKVVLVGTVG